MSTSFGIDLSGYSTAGTALAMAQAKSQSIVVTLMDNHCFARSHKGDSKLDEIIDNEAKVLAAIMKMGPVYVDVPIDLQGLPCPADTRFVWEQTKRPIDKAFAAMPPLADRIGSCVTRMRLIMDHLRGQILGETLFEAYPSATLRLSNLSHQKYKGASQYNGGRWEGQPAHDKKKKVKNDTLADNLNQLGWTASENFTIAHDEFDAAICSLTGVVSPNTVLAADRLERIIAERLKGVTSRTTPPAGYALLKRIPRGIHIEWRPCEQVLG